MIDKGRIKKLLLVVLLVIVWLVIERLAHSHGAVDAPRRRLLWIIVGLYLLFASRAIVRRQVTNSIVWACPAIVLGAMLLTGYRISISSATLFALYLVVPISWEFIVPPLVAVCSSLSTVFAVLLVSTRHSEGTESLLGWCVALPLILVFVWWLVNWDEIYDHVRKLNLFK